MNLINIDNDDGISFRVSRIDYDTSQYYQNLQVEVSYEYKFKGNGTAHCCF